ncbi:hypothetical protein [Nostoc sp. CALU 546]
MSKTTTSHRKKAAVNKRIVLCNGEKGGTGKSIGNNLSDLKIN